MLAFGEISWDDKILTGERSSEGFARAGSEVSESKLMDVITCNDFETLYRRIQYWSIIKELKEY